MNTLQALLIHPPLWIFCAANFDEGGHPGPIDLDDLDLVELRAIYNVRPEFGAKVVSPFTKRPKKEQIDAIKKRLKDRVEVMANENRNTAYFYDLAQSEGTIAKCSAMKIIEEEQRLNVEEKELTFKEVKEAYDIAMNRYGNVIAALTTGTPEEKMQARKEKARAKEERIEAEKDKLEAEYALEILRADLERMRKSRIGFTTTVGGWWQPGWEEELKLAHHDRQLILEKDCNGSEIKPAFDPTRTLVSTQSSMVRMWKPEDDLKKKEYKRAMDFREAIYEVWAYKYESSTADPCVRRFENYNEAIEHFYDCVPSDEEVQSFKNGFRPAFGRVKLCISDIQGGQYEHGHVIPEHQDDKYKHDWAMDFETYRVQE